MSLFHSPSLVTSGLVLCLDAGNSKSYPGSGTTWTDLSGRGNTVPMTNGAGYDGQSLIYDGTTQRTSIDLPALKTENITLSTWFKQTKIYAGSDGIVVAAMTDHNNWRNGYYIYYGYAMYFATGNGSNFYSTSTSISLNAWVNIVGTFSGSTLNMYKNGTLVASETGSLSYAASNRFGIAAGSGYPSAAYFGGNIGQISYYNRALSAAEISQNFNALRGRYGV